MDSLWVGAFTGNRTFDLIDCNDPAYLHTDGNYNAMSSTYTNSLTYTKDSMASCMRSLKLSKVILDTVSNLALSVW